MQCPVARPCNVSPRSPRWLHQVLAASLLVATTACHDAEPPTAAEHPGTVTAIPAEERARLKARAKREHAAGEAHLHELAAAIPGFAGVYFSTPTELTVLATGDVDAAYASNHVRDVLLRSGRRPVRGEWTFRLEKARYTFHQLADWRDAVAEVLLSVGDLSSLDLNERDNRIDVGVARSGAMAAVARVLNDTDVPADAFHVEERSRAHETQGVLEGTMRPLRGGIGVGPRKCTMNSIALWGGVPRVVINSHCSATPFGLDAPTPYLSQPAGAQERWGVEIWDSKGYACGVLDRDRCRRAEVALFTANPNVYGGDQPYAFGELARPRDRVPGYANDSGWNKPLDPNSVRLRIVGVVEAPWQGEIVDKIGINSGWTYGPVLQTCVNPIIQALTFPLRARVMVCQQRAEYNSNGGDSGGPVFIYLGGDSVLYAGINWGNSGAKGDDTGIDGYFSPVAQMRVDLSQYSLQFYYPKLGPLPPFIVGPTQLLAGEWGTWSPSTKATVCDWWVDDQRVVAAGSCQFNYTFSEYPRTYSITVVADGVTIDPIHVSVTGEDGDRSGLPPDQASDRRTRHGGNRSPR